MVKDSRLLLPAKLFSQKWILADSSSTRVLIQNNLHLSSLEFKLMQYEMANASASFYAPWTGATWIDQCCFVSIDDIIIYSRNAVEHFYHLRLVSERLNETGMKIKPDDVKQNSMTYLSESEDSEHSLAGGVIQYIYYIFSILVFSLHTVEAYIRHICAELCSILFYYFIFFYCNLWLLFRVVHSSIVILTVAFIPPCKGIKFCFA